jgi:integrase
MNNDVPTIAEDRDLEDTLRGVLQASQDPLEPITPADAVQMYLDDRERDCQQATVKGHRSRLSFFVNWCDDQGVDDMNDLSARDLHEFQVWRREDLNVVSERTQMSTLRVFIKWCETIDAVPEGLFNKINVPNVPRGEGSREKTLHADRVEEIVEYLGKYEYATVEHVSWLILAETGIRIGAAHALDIDDYRPNAETPHLKIAHRPKTDTPIKNGNRGERPVAISSEVCGVIDDYLDHQRPDVTDDHGRAPLLASVHGRVAKSTIRTYIYKWSRPCEVSDGCPHDREPTDCEAVVDLDNVSKCPSSVTPHPIRRGYITHLLTSGVPVEVVSERCNVSPNIIDQHYDVRSAEEKMRQRQQVLEER